MAEFCAQHMWNYNHGPCCLCMNFKQKLAYVWAQWREAMDESAQLQCPYCLGITQAGKAPCCKTMARAIAAILEREDVMRVVMGGSPSPLVH